MRFFFFRCFFKYELFFDELVGGGKSFLYSGDKGLMKLYFFLKIYF